MLMAQCGIPVPAQHPVVIPPVSSVLADVGDEQSLEASLSTFSGHLRRIQVCVGPRTYCHILSVYMLTLVCAVSMQ